MFHSFRVSQPSPDSRVNSEVRLHSRQEKILRPGAEANTEVAPFWWRVDLWSVYLFLAPPLSLSLFFFPRPRALASSTAGGYLDASPV